jgi:hypothetical protein
MRHRSSSQSRRCWTGYCTTRACGISVEATACRGHEAALYAFDLIEHDGDDLRDLPLIERKRRLARLLGRAKRRSIRFTEHLTGDGPTVFDHVCRMGLEGIVSKRRMRPIAAGHQRRGSSRRTRRARRCVASARKNGFDIRLSLEGFNSNRR